MTDELTANNWVTFIKCELKGGIRVQNTIIISGIYSVGEFANRRSSSKYIKLNLPKFIRYHSACQNFIEGLIIFWNCYNHGCTSPKDEVLARRSFTQLLPAESWVASY